jgi:hypothetical protein
MSDQISNGRLRVSFRSRSGGVVVTLESRGDGGWKPLIKIDAFGLRPHWHLALEDGRESIRPLPVATALYDQCLLVLDEISQLLDTESKNRSSMLSLSLSDLEFVRNQIRTRFSL